MICKECGEELIRLDGVSSDPDGIRQDAYCLTCHIRYGVRAYGLVVEAEPYEKIVIEDPINEEKEDRKLVSNLAMLVRLFIVKIGKSNPDDSTVRKASRFLKKHGLTGNPLR